MGIISKIRHRAGLAVGVVAVAMGLFIVGTDIFSKNSSILGKNQDTVGEIDGINIEREEFQNTIDEFKYKFTVYNQRTPTEADMFNIRNSAWEFLIVKVAFQDQYDKLGIQVTREEQIDMVQGENVHPDIRRNFTNPETGEFNKQYVVNYLANIKKLDPSQQAMWYMFEKDLIPSRYRLKYENLLIKGTYSTNVEAEHQHFMDNAVAEVKYLYVPYYTVDNEKVTVSDSDLKEYYNKHKDEFEVEESRSISYVTFPIVPSSEDTAFIKDEMNRLRKDFASAPDDSIFAKINSDDLNYFSTYNISQLPDILSKNVSNLSQGDIRGPYFVNNALTLYKITSISKSDNEDDAVVKASHILVKWENDTDEAKAKAMQEAKDILRQLSNGADFETLAKEKSQDPGSGRAGGDLGWFGKGRMVKPFEDAVFGANKVGLVNRVVESSFGYHIIKVTEPISRTQFKVATIRREILPGVDTQDKAFRQADLFASSVDGYKEFVQRAGKDSIDVLIGEKLKKNDRRIGTLGEAREIIKWAYNTKKVGSVSDVFQLDDQDVVAVLTEKEEKGIASFEDVKSNVQIKVQNEKKGDFIINKLKGLGQASLDQLAEKYGTDANVYTNSSLKMAGNTLTSVGFAPRSIGMAFGLEPGATSMPIREDNGIIIMQLESLTPASPIADYTRYKNQIEGKYRGRVSFAVSEVIKEHANIKDERYRLY